MPWTEDAHASLHEHHRMIEARSGSTRMEIVFDPRFDYGRQATRIDVAEHGVVATGPDGQRLCLSVSAKVKFVSRYEGNEMDATLLLLPTSGFLPPDDPRITRTLDRVVKELGEGEFLLRYRSDDGIESEEGAFILCGFWLSEALAMNGRLDEAFDAFNQHAQLANHVGLLSEEVDPSSRALLGNFPQAFSHLGLIQAAARLDLALRLRDEGHEQAPRHAIDRVRS
jgi:GH15 family glucan-1,4-alpha-glucosidase